MRGGVWLTIIDQTHSKYNITVTTSNFTFSFHVLAKHLKVNQDRVVTVRKGIPFSQFRTGPCTCWLYKSCFIGLFVCRYAFMRASTRVRMRTTVWGLIFTFMTVYTNLFTYTLMHLRMRNKALSFCFLDRWQTCAERIRNPGYPWPIGFSGRPSYVWSMFSYHKFSRNCPLNSLIDDFLVKIDACRPKICLALEQNLDKKCLIGYKFPSAIVSCKAKTFFSNWCVHEPTK